MWLSDLSIRQPHSITMLIVGVIVVGALLYSRMGLDLFPDVSLPVVAVRTVYAGASPSEVERSVSKVMEDAVVSINGVDSVRSTSTDGVSIVVVEFGRSTPRPANGPNTTLPPWRSTSRTPAP
jgi:multidrug efflux pump subunit AcrB